MGARERGRLCGYARTKCGITGHGNAMAKNSILEWNFCTAAPLSHHPPSGIRQDSLTAFSALNLKALSPNNIVRQKANLHGGQSLIQNILKYQSYRYIAF